MASQSDAPRRPGRPRGARGPRHADRRRLMLDRMAARLSAADALHASYRDLAEAAGASISTIQLYFGKRTDIVAAILADARERAAPFLAQLRTPAGDFPASVRDALAFTRLGFEQFGLSGLFAMGLSEGLRHSVLGPRFLADVLELSIEAIAARLAEHQARGDMRPDIDPRAAAIRLLSPLVILYLHQKELGGQAEWPIDIDRFTSEHADTFIRAHAAGTARAEP
jgi:AcrR family transcriptional regulator